VVTALNRYMVVRARHGAINRDSLPFLSSSGGLLPTQTIHWVFQQLRRDLGWTARGAHIQARIHDLRHTFICRRVQLWHEQGTDIGNAMSALSTYVCHAKVSDTYWYLTGIPDLMAIAGSRSGAWWAYLLVVES
jgi:integrase